VAQNLTDKQVRELAEELTQHVADAIASAIDAGSEREAVEEDLIEFFNLYVLSWSNNPDIVSPRDNDQIGKVNDLLRKLNA
jgi:hypothetical protein